MAVREGSVGEYHAWRLVWVTAGGWVLSSQIEINDTSSSVRRRPPNCHLHFSTRPIQFVYENGQPCDRQKPAWSLPEHRLALSGSDRALVWERVPDHVVHRLPSNTYDDRVLDVKPVLPVSGSTKPSLCWLNLRDIVQSCRSCGNIPTKLQRVPLSKRMGPPTCLAVHPDHEWIVVGTNHQGIQLLNARGETKRSTPKAVPLSEHKEEK